MLTAEDIEPLHTGLTVSMAMTHRDQIQSCIETELVSHVVFRNDQRFSYIPVRCEQQPNEFIGLLYAETWFATHPPSAPISGYYEPLSERNLIGADASILHFVRDADNHPCRLVVSGHQIGGMITLSNLQQLPVRASLFALLTGFELLMATVIKHYFQSSDEWLNLLSDERRLKVSSEIERSQREDGFVNSLLFTQFCDKTEIIRKRIDLGISKSSLKTKFASFRKLRDDLAHANEYAATPNAARGVAETVRQMLELELKLKSLKLESIEAGRPGWASSQQS